MRASGFSLFRVVLWALSSWHSIPATCHPSSVALAPITASCRPCSHCLHWQTAQTLGVDAIPLQVCSPSHSIVVTGHTGILSLPMPGLTFGLSAYRPRKGPAQPPLPLLLLAQFLGVEGGPWGGVSGHRRQQPKTAEPSASALEPGGPAGREHLPPSSGFSSSSAFWSSQSCLLLQRFSCLAESLPLISSSPSCFSHRSRWFPTAVPSHTLQQPPQAPSYPSAVEPKLAVRALCSNAPPVAAGGSGRGPRHSECLLH